MAARDSLHYLVAELHGTGEERYLTDTGCYSLNVCCLRLASPEHAAHSGASASPQITRRCSAGLTPGLRGCVPEPCYNPFAAVRG